MEKVSSSNITKIALISLDLDDTLLTSRKTIPPYTQSILQRLQEMGMILVLNSGRFYHEIKPYADQLQLAKYGGYVISANGQRIHAMRTDKSYEFPMITIQDANDFLSFAKQHHLMCYSHDRTHYHFYASFFYRMMFSCAQWVGKTLPVVKHHLPNALFAWEPSPYPETLSIPLEKLCLIALPHHLRQMNQYIKQQHPGYHTFPINRLSKEIVHSSISKKNAIEKLCQDLSLSMDQVLAFGDAGNDLPLLQEAGIAYTMKNAHPAILRQASRITTNTNDEEGVAKTLASLFL